MSSLASHFRVPLVDLGDIVEERLAGILIPQPEIGQEKLGISSLYLDGAADYHQRYTNLAYFKTLLEHAFARIGNVPHDASILDIGAGSGNSVFPCLELLRKCRIVAIDLSPDLLRMLLMALRQAGVGSDRVTGVCMDASHDYFQPGTFQLVVGAAILHHLIDPMLAIRAAAQSLAPGGSAVFFEPFEAGNSILRIAYTDIVRRASARKIDRPIVDLLRRFLRRPRRHGAEDLDQRAVDFLNNMVLDYQIRAGADKAADIFRRVDEKWLFTRTYFEDCARAVGIGELIIYPLHPAAHAFRAQTETNLRLGAGLAADALPRWAWEVLDDYDNLFSDELKRELLIEGCIILRKAC